MKTLSILSFVMSITFSMYAQENPSAFTFNHLALSVKDVDKAAEFYINILELKEITNKTKKEGIRWISLGEGKELHLISLVKEEVKINQAVHLALTTPHFDNFLTRLNIMKVKYFDWEGKPDTVNKRADGVKQIYFKDEDGYWIEVNSTGK